jgi:hypothetical protein
MSQLVHFYAGNPEVIGRAFESHDFATLNDRSKIPLFADFSLHLAPIDYELLSEAIQSAVGDGPGSLEDALETQVGGSDDEASANIVSREWVQMVAAVRDDQIETILAAWIRATAEEHREPLTEPTDEVRRAFRELIALCRDAQARGLAVVHTWSL